MGPYGLMPPSGSSDSTNGSPSATVAAVPDTPSDPWVKPAVPRLNSEQVELLQAMSRRVADTLGGPKPSSPPTPPVASTKLQQIADEICPPWARAPPSPPRERYTIYTRTRAKTRALWELPGRRAHAGKPAAPVKTVGKAIHVST